MAESVITWRLNYQQKSFLVLARVKDAGTRIGNKTEMWEKPDFTSPFHECSVTYYQTEKRDNYFMPQVQNSRDKYRLACLPILNHCL